MKLIIKRAISFIVDYLLLSGLVSVFYFCATIFFLDEKTFAQGELMLICAVIMIFLLTIYLPVTSSGQTIGERLMKIKILNKNNSELNWKQCFIRNCVLKFIFAPFFFIVVGLYYFIFNVIRKDNENELIHDNILKTKAIMVL